MGGISPQGLLILAAVTLAVWLAGQAVEGVQWVGRQSAHVAEEIGCGMKWVFTGHGCDDEDDETPPPPSPDPTEQGESQ